MLPDTVIERLDQFMSVKVEELKKEASEEFSRASADAAQRGHQTPSSATGIRHMVQVHLVQKRIAAVVEYQNKLALALQLPFSDTLADDLKAQVESYVSTKWCEDLLKMNGGLSPEHAEHLKEDLFKERTFSLGKAGDQIDFLVDSIRIKQASQPQVQTKELAQKFKILWSPGQAVKDFQTWQKELQESSSVAVMFLDIDHFKELNTAFTENRIDGTLLPEVQRFLKRLIAGRGDAYHQGGDEFILIMPNVDTSEAIQFAEKIRGAFEHHKFVVEQKTVPITLSIGIALWPNHGTTYEEVSLKANEAEHDSKATRNCVTLADTTRAVKLLPYSGLSEAAQRLAVLLCSKSLNGLEHDPMEDPATLAEELHLTPKELAVAADELNDRAWITQDAGFRKLWPRPELFLETDAYVKGWNPAADAKQLAAALLKKPDEESTLQALGAELSWEPRRLNSAASLLSRGGYVTTSKVMSPEPLVFQWMKATPKTHRFVQGGS